MIVHLMLWRMEFTITRVDRRFNAYKELGLLSLSISIKPNAYYKLDPLLT